MSEQERGRSTTLKPLTPSPGRDNADNADVAMSSPTNGAKVPSSVVVVTGLSKNVLVPHLEEIFGEYGRVSGLDLPVFKVCECLRAAVPR